MEKEYSKISTGAKHNLPQQALLGKPAARPGAKKHLPTVDAWESVFMESDRVPAPGQRSYVLDVKTLAQQILRELGGF